MGFKLSAFTFLAVVFASNLGLAKALTYSEACGLIEKSMANFPEDSAGRKSMTEDHQANCVKSAWQPNQWKQEYPIPLNSYVDAAPDSVNTAETAKRQAEEKLSSLSQGDVAGFFNSCREQAATSQADCRNTLAMYKDTYKATYNSIYSGLVSRNSQSIENACSSAGNFSSEASSKMAAGIQACEQHKAVCLQVCKAAEDRAAAEQVNPNSEEQRWINLNREVGNTSCARITDNIGSVQSDIQTAQNNLNSQCQQARRDLKSEEKQAAKEDESDMGSLTQAAGQALQQLGQALQQPQVPGMMPYQMPVSELGTGLGYSNSGSANVGVNKGSNYGGGGTTTGADDIVLGDDLPIAKPYEKSQMGQGSLPGGGGGGGAPQASTKAAAEAAKKRAGGGRASLDSEIYKGYYGGAGGPGGGGFKVSGGYPNGGGPGGGGRGPAPRLQAGKPNMVNINQFAPKWAGRRSLATTVGPDGITGPHTDQFKKIRLSYESQLSNLD